MAIAIIKHKDLTFFAAELGFPFKHRMNLIKGGTGYETFDKFIRAKVQWVNELDFRKHEDIKVWTSAKIIGDVPSPEKYYSRGILGSTEGSAKLDDTGFVAIGNYWKAIESISEDYIVDYVEKEEPAYNTVAVEEYIRIIVGDTVEDSYLGYGVDIPVERLWTIHYEFNIGGRFWVERSVFPAESDSDERFYVREMGDQEIGKHFESIDGVTVRRVEKVAEVKDVEVEESDFTKEKTIEAVLDPHRVVESMRATMQVANSMAYIKSGV